jgi:myo-inositol-1(or 4)-monophosphatase
MSLPERRLAIEAARAAGELLRSELTGARRIAFKGAPTNLVTEMDARAETLILERLRAACPDDAILSEEMGAASGRSGRRWIIDPLDGTTNYAHGVPLYGVSIALEIAGRIDLGVI